MMLPPALPPFDGLLPDPDQLLAGALRAHQQPLSPAVPAALTALGVPPADYLSTLISARIGLLAAAQGQHFVPHELRRRIPPTEGLLPDAVVADHSVPRWREGVLEEPKYFSFFLDTRVAVYNPNHRRKWRPHESLHGLIGFAWQPGLTPFECYAGARICELLPVTHWYGYDEILRPRCPQHTGQLLYRLTCPRCEALSAQPYTATADPSDALLAQSRAAIARAGHYLSVEVDAIRRELDTGRRVITHHPRLDGASDAQGYLRGHYERLTAWSFGATVERFLVAGVDYHSSPHALLQHMLATHQAMLCDDIVLDEARAVRLRARRELQDSAYRTLRALEWLEPDSAAEATLEPALDRMATVCADLLADRATATAAAEALANLLARFATVADHFPPEVAAAFPAPGYGPQALPAGAPQLAEGLLSAFPSTLGDQTEDARLALALEFAASPAAQGPGSLRQRFAAWTTDPAVRLEGWLHDLPRRDSDAELLATLPDTPEEDDEEVDPEPTPPEWLRLNSTLRRALFPAETVASALDDPDAAAPPFLRADGMVELCGLWWHDAPQLLPLDAGTAAALDAVDAGEPLHPEDLAPLLEVGAVIYLPPPRR